VNKFFSSLNRIIEWVIGILLAFIIALSFLQVLSRYVFHFSYPWTEEIARLLLVWATFFGACIAIRRKSHMRVDYIFNKFTEKGRLFLALFIDSLLIIIAVFMIVEGSKYCMQIAYDTETSLRYSKSLFFWPVPLSGFIMIFFLSESISISIIRVKKLIFGAKK